MLRNAYRSWYIKKRLEEVEAFGIERDLAGLPVLFAPPHLFSPNASAADKALLASLERIVTGVRRDEREGVVFPAPKYTDPSTPDKEITTGYDFKLMVAGGSRQLAIGEAIERHEHRMAVSLLADFVLLGSGPNGSWALSSDKTDMFSIAMGFILDVICSVINRQAIPPLMRLNAVPPPLWPKVTHGDIESPSLDEVQKYVVGLAGAGMITPDPQLEAHLREIANLPDMMEAGDPGLGDLTNPQDPALAAVYSEHPELAPLPAPGAPGPGGGLPALPDPSQLAPGAVG
jgi:hypothetical protein